MDDLNTTFENFTLHHKKYPGVQVYVVMVMLTILSIVGTVGNFLVLYVFAQKKDRLTSTIFILALAVIDLTTCMINLPFTIYMEYNRFMIRIDIMCKIYQGLITSTIPFSALLMAAIAADRYFCICHPFLHAFNIRRAKIICVCLGLVAASLGVITSLAYGVYKQKTMCHEVPLEILIKSPSNTTMQAAGFHIGESGSIPFSNARDTDSENKNTETSYRNFVNGRSHLSHNISVNSTTNGESHKRDRDCIQTFILEGVCDQNLILVHEQFFWVYHKIYTSLFLIVLIIVSVLYVLIYNSVMRRRRRRQKQKKHLPPIPMTTTDEPGLLSEETQITTTNINGNMDVKNGSTRDTKEKSHKSGIEQHTHGSCTQQRNRKSNKSKKDRNRCANVKTAIMLFVVTVVFIITYMPAFFMALNLLPYNAIVFYMYFANNVANPIIYSFMNKNFRDDLKKIFNCKP